MKNRTGLTLFALLVCVAPLRAFASVIDELSTEDREKVLNGEQVLNTAEVAGTRWPRALAYQYIEASPEQVAALLWDFELQTSYAPSIKKSSISARLRSSDLYVDYTMGLPFPIPNENYTVECKLSTYDNGASYRTDVRLISADSLKRVNGNIRVEKLKRGTLMAYDSFVEPGFPYSVLLRDYALGQFGDTITATLNQMNLEVKSGQDLMSRQISVLRQAIAGQ